MPDLLVKLYNLPPGESRDTGFLVRGARAYEKHKVVPWVRTTFGAGWADECEVAFSRSPISCHVATHAGRIAGFACWDSTCRGFFGPLGVEESWRLRGVGRSLLLSCLRAMASAGYAYAIVGGAGPTELYVKAAGAVEIPGSSPGIYQDPLKENNP